MSANNVVCVHECVANEAPLRRFMMQARCSVSRHTVGFIGGEWKLMRYMKYEIRDHVVKTWLDIIKALNALYCGPEVM